MDYIEKEVKYEVKDIKGLFDYLKRNGFIYMGYHLEKTIRIDTPDMDYSNKGLFFRLRSGFKDTLTLKSKRNELSEVSERKEIELEISSISKCMEIMRCLGLTKQLVMEKYRMLWKLNDITVTIDELPFGIYSEIEGPIQSIKIISDLLGFNYDNRIRITYWELHRDKISEGVMPESQNILFPENYLSKLVL